MGRITMSTKEAQRPGLVRAARNGKITNREGAEALRISVRQFRRLKRRFEAEGVPGLIHRGRGLPSPRRLSETVRHRVGVLLQGRYAGFNDCHLAEMLVEQEGLQLSRATVQRIRAELGVAPKRRRRPPQHRRRRERQAHPGALVLIDGSEHRWCEKRCDRFTLVGAIDDATGTILGLVARPHEDLHGYAVLLRHVIAAHGLPLALYGDRTNIFVRTDRHWTIEEELAGERTPTQAGRILKSLGIGYIAAHSPQAKGRIERFWGTLQDRLVSVLRLRGATSLEATSRLLPSFIEDFNRRFTEPPRDPAPAWRRAPRDLERHLSCEHSRIVAKDNTVTLADRWIQIPRGSRGRSYAGCRVDLVEPLDGTLLIRYRGTILAQQEAPSEPFTLRPRRHRAQGPKQPRQRPEPKPSAPRKGRCTPQSPDHPWKSSYKHSPVAHAPAGKGEDTSTER